MSVTHVRAMCEWLASLTCLNSVWSEKGVAFRAKNAPLNTIRNSRITYHHFILRELFLVIISSWFTSENSGRIISRNLSDLHLLHHIL